MTRLERFVEMLPLTWPDWLALLFLVAVWISYQWHVGVLYVLHQREFRSQTLRALAGQG